MLVQPIQNISFGKAYYAGMNEVTRTQKDVLEDIKDKIEEGDFVKRLEAIKYDIYVEPRKDGYSMDVAFMKKAKINSDGKLVFDKIVMMGAYMQNIGKYSSVRTDASDVYSIDTLTNRFNKFFKNYSINKYKRYVNHL